MENDKKQDTIDFKGMSVNDYFKSNDFQEFIKTMREQITANVNITESQSDELLITIPIKKISSELLPFYGSVQAAGADVRANVNEETVIYPHTSKMISTGLYVAIPRGYEIQIRPRSGIAAKNIVTVLNSPGTIDSDYRGEIKIILINHSDKNFFINRGDRIAQMVLMKLPPHMSFQEFSSDEWEIWFNTQRGNSGFGSTGVN